MCSLLLSAFAPRKLLPFAEPTRRAGAPATILGIITCLALAARQLPSQEVSRLDPVRWGSDHAGKPVPAFTSGDECLFCHRMDVGPGWSANRHGQTVRSVDPGTKGLQALAKAPELKALAAEVELLLGGSNRMRFLKRSAEHGKLDLLSVEWTPEKSEAEGKLVSTERPHWDSHTFGSRCAGCHATGVDSKKQTFAAASLDCFVCHGEVSDKHTTQGSLVLLSPKRTDSPAAITSVCAQCHLRTGTSRSSGLPYPNNFVAGDNLFRDFQVDLSDAAIDKLNPADRHVQQNVRDVILLGNERVTCLTCHSAHRQTVKQHHRVAESAICANCHNPSSKRIRVPFEVHSTTCGY
jgi:hypothetical protein